MKIDALDLATRTGIAWGVAGEVPQSASIRLNKGEGAETYDHLFAMAADLQRYLFSRWRFKDDRPDLCAIEHPIPMQRGRAQDPARPETKSFLGGVSPAALLPWMLAATTCSLAATIGIKVVRPWSGTVTAHFLGKGKVPKGDRKPLILARCHMLGYLPPDCKDLDRSDACAIWDWAAATHGRKIPRELVMYGERARTAGEGDERAERRAGGY